MPPSYAKVLTAVVAEAEAIRFCRHAAMLVFRAMRQVFSAPNPAVIAVAT